MNTTRLGGSNPLNTIASIGAINQPIPFFIVSSVEPTQRQEGVALVQGDRWFNPDNNEEHVYVNGKWELVSGGTPAPPQQPGIGEAPIDGNAYARKDANWSQLVPTPQTQYTTGNLPLVNPTTTFTPEEGLPDTSGLATQEDYNKWIFDALSQLEDKMEECCNKGPDGILLGRVDYNGVIGILTTQTPTDVTDQFTTNHLPTLGEDASTLPKTTGFNLLTKVEPFDEEYRLFTTQGPMAVKSEGRTVTHAFIPSFAPSITTPRTEDDINNFVYSITIGGFSFTPVLPVVVAIDGNTIKHGFTISPLPELT